MTEAFREGQPSEIPRGAEGELPEAKIFDLLSSVGNGENKALELIVMREGVIYSKNPLYQEVMSHQEENRRWKMAENTPFSHCEKSLSPIGLVTKEALRPDGSAWGYQITEFGLHTGVPFAGLLLKWSSEHPNHSLYKMFGSTQSKSIKDEQTLEKKRAQEIRYKIFWEMVTNPSNRIRVVDITNEISENHSLIQGHLLNLNKNGVISSEAKEPGRSYSYLRRKEVLIDQGPKQYRQQKTLSPVVYDLLTREYLSVEEVVSLIIQRHPEYVNLNRKSLSQTILAALSRFERRGYLERKKFAYDFQSHITLSDEQREAIVSLVTFIDNFKNGDREMVEEGKRFAQKVASDSNLFSELMLKAKEASPPANSTNREDMEDWIVSIIYQYSNRTVKQIQQTLEEDYDKSITVHGLRYQLAYLVKGRKIISEKTKSGNVYRVVEEENQTPSPQD